MPRIERSLAFIKPLQTLRIADGEPTGKVAEKQRLPLVLICGKPKRVCDAAEHILHRIVPGERARNRYHDVDAQQFALLEHRPRREAFQHAVAYNTNEQDKNRLDEKRQARTVKRVVFHLNQGHPIDIDRDEQNAQDERAARDAC